MRWTLQVQGVRTSIEQDLVAPIRATPTSRGRGVEHDHSMAAASCTAGCGKAGQAATHDDDVGTNVHVTSTSERLEP